MGIVVVALTYAASRLPRWSDLMTGPGRMAFVAATLLLGLATVEAACVLAWLSRAVAPRPYQRIGPEPGLRAGLEQLQAFYQNEEVASATLDSEILNDMQQALLDSYTAVTPINRDLNQLRYRHRAWAISYLVRSLI